MAKRTGALSENVNYAVKSSQLLAFLSGGSSASVFSEPTTKPPQTAEPEMIQQVKDATVFITVERD